MLGHQLLNLWTRVNNHKLSLMRRKQDSQWCCREYAARRVLQDLASKAYWTQTIISITHMAGEAGQLSNRLGKRNASGSGVWVT
jgi:hypothetical protein